MEINTHSNNKRKLGKNFEIAAFEFLSKRGCILIKKNYTCVHGEIDLIMKDHNDIIFVEVRSRSGDDYGSSIESISKSKQEKIIRSSVSYLLENNLYNKVHCRFDIVGISKIQQTYDIDWIPNAFSSLRY